MTEAAPNANEGTSTSTTETAGTAPAPTVTQQATDSQPTDTATGDKADTGTGDSTTPTEKVGAPEKYEFKPTEGVQFDDTVLAAYADVAKELDLPQDAAQKVLDKVAPVLAQRQLESLRATHDGWVDSVKADKEIGGGKLDENLAIAKKALTTFGSPELVSFLRESGLGSHPEVVRFFLRAGKQISEDKMVTGSSGTGGKKDAATALYPNQTH